MALADIVQRIERDGVAEAATVVADAQKNADSLVTEAREAAERARVQTLDQADRDARAEAATLLANERLAARDRMLTARRELIDRTLARALETLGRVGDEQYADLVARRLVRSAHGGERVLIAAADVPRLVERLPAAVARAGGGGLALVWSSESAPVGHGVVLRGDRMSVDLSVEATIEERRDELAMVAAAILFAEAGD